MVLLPWEPNLFRDAAFASQTLLAGIADLVGTSLTLATGSLVDAPADAAIINLEALRRPCVLGTLHLIYSALAAAAEEPAQLIVRAELYERLYRRSLEQAVLQLDLNADGRADTIRRLNIVNLVRT